MTSGFSIFPNIVDMFERAVEHATKVVTAAGHALFDDDHPPAQTPLQRTNTALYGPGGPPTAPPPAPAPPADNAGGLNDGAGNAGDQHNKNVGGAALTDDKLATLLKQIFESNTQARDKVNAILADIQAKTKQIAPEMGDPASVMAFQKFMDQKFGEIQKLLSDSQIDAKTQASIMDALGQEYRTNGPKSDAGGDKGSGTSGGASSAGDGGEAGAPPDAGAGASGAPADPGAGASPLTDPMAGMGPMGLGGMGGMDPMSSLAGLGSALPGMLGGLGGGGGSPLDALGPALGSALPGLASQFGDKAGHDQSGADDKFSDTKGEAKDGKPGDVKFADEGKSDGPRAEQGKPDTKSPADPTTVQPVSNAAPGAVAPAAAPAPDAHIISLPDGTSVTVAEDQRHAAVQAVLDGKSVSAAYGDQIPPPGSPVMNPVDRDKLRPGDYAQFDAKPAVMYVGNGKIMLDGQLKPVSALPSSTDFLGWTGPPAAGAGTQAPPTPAPTGTPALVSVPPATPPSGNHTV